MPGKIADFGERIEGARKHFAQAYLARLDAAEGRTLSALWPNVDWQQLIDSGVKRPAVGLARAIREDRPAAPKGAYARERWIAQTREWRRIASGFLSAAPEDQTVAKLVEQGRLLADWDSSLEGKTVLYCELGHERSLKDCSLRYGTSYERDPDTRALKKERGWKLYRANRLMTLGIFEDIKDAAGALNANLAEHPDGVNVGRPRLHVKCYRSQPGVFHIVHKTGKGGFGARRDGCTILASFPSPIEAHQQITERYDEWVARLKQLRKIPPKHSAAQGERIGLVLRSSDVTREMFEEVFEPRGVQFGNYVTGAERQQALNQTYDALMDLSALLDVRPKQLFFSGQLGLAFGARGSGGRLAHFEPRPANVINLTRTKGAGALAHEWFHALDHEIGHRVSGGHAVGMLSEQARAGQISNRVLAKPLKAAAEVLRQCTAADAPMTRRGVLLDGFRGKPYWSLAREVAARTFESAVLYALGDQRQRNPFLVSLGSFKEWTDWSRLAGIKPMRPFLQPDEQPVYGSAILEMASKMTAWAEHRDLEASRQAGAVAQVEEQPQ